jgi:hypothetical protein
MTEDTSTNNTMLNRKQATIIKIGLQEGASSVLQRNIASPHPKL